MFAQYNGNLISPIPFAIYLRIVNLQPVPSYISQLTVEIEASPKKWIFPATWLKGRFIPPSMPLVWGNPSRSALRINLIGEQLMPILENAPLQAHQTVRGWVLLDVPASYDSAPHPCVFRISIADTARNALSTIRTGPYAEDNIGPERGIVTHGPVDVRSYTVTHYADWAN
jgi:hypothetical protein